MMKRLIVGLLMVIGTYCLLAAQDSPRQTALPTKGNLAVGWGFMPSATSREPDGEPGDFLLVWINFQGDQPGRLFVGKIHGSNPSIQELDPKDPSLLGLFASYWQGQTERYRLRHLGASIVVELIFDPGEAPPGERPSTEAIQTLLRVNLQKTAKVSALPPVVLDPPIFRRPLFWPAKPALVGDDVSFVQALLMDPGDVDGIFGKKTTQAVIKYQTQNGLEADGVVGKRTWQALLWEFGDPLGD